jgi:hypothetical protein
VADFASRIKELQADFQNIAGRAGWVGARVAVRPGEIGAFGLGRPGSGRYAISRAWGYAWVTTLRGLPGPNGDKGNIQNESPPNYSELLTLTERAGTLLEDMCQAGLYEVRRFPPQAVPYTIVDLPVQHPLVRAAQSVQRWLVFLLHSPGTLGYCLVKAPGGMVAACGQIRAGKTTVVCIDQFAEVCLAGLALLKAGLETSSPAGAGTHADGPEGGCWFWWENRRNDVPKGTLYRLLDYMCRRESAQYDALYRRPDSPVYDDPVAVQTIRSDVSQLNGILKKIGVPWVLSCNSRTRHITKKMRPAGKKKRRASNRRKNP